MKLLISLFTLLSIAVLAETRVTVRYPSGQTGWGPLILEDDQVDEWINEHAFPRDYTIQTEDISTERGVEKAVTNGRRGAIRASLAANATPGQVRAGLKALIEELNVRTEDER